jgi:hypothetical protein
VNSECFSSTSELPRGTVGYEFFSNCTIGLDLARVRFQGAHKPGSMLDLPQVYPTRFLAFSGYNLVTKEGVYATFVGVELGFRVLIVWCVSRGGIGRLALSLHRQ